MTGRRQTVNEVWPNYPVEMSDMRLAELKQRHRLCTTNRYYFPPLTRDEIGELFTEIGLLREGKACRKTMMQEYQRRAYAAEERVAMIEKTSQEKRALLVRFVKTVAGLFSTAIAVLYVLRGGKR